MLVCEDVEDTKELFADMFRLHGYEVTCVSSGEAAVAVLLAEQIDVAVIDVGLPDMSGFDIARRVRQAGRRVGLIAVTGYATAGDRATAKLVGFDEHFAKPVKMTALIAAVERVRQR